MYSEILMVIGPNCDVLKETRQTNQSPSSLLNEMISDLFLLKCPKSKSLWNSIFNWAWNNFERDLKCLTETELILGVTEVWPNPESEVVNALLLFTRNYIHMKRLYFYGKAENT